MRHRLRRSFILSIALALTIAFVAELRAEHTRRWRQTSYEEFLRGSAHGIAVRSDGRLELAPRFRPLADADASYLWSVRVDPKGVLYAAGGSPAKVLRFDAAGKPAAVFESTELSAQALAFDGKGNLYVATTPDGRVYRVTPQGEKSVFFDPKTKYIWDLSMSPDGTLYVATGDKGQIFAVSPDGKSEIFYSSDEAHIRVLALDARGNLLAGTEPSGRILRLSLAPAKNGQQRAAFVLHETSKREVTALVVAPDGSVYASAIGEKQKPPAAGAAPSAISPQAAISAAGVSGAFVSQAGGQALTPFAPFPPLLSSSIYRIAPDGAPEEIWSSREDVVYSLGLNADGRVLAGTGNSGSLLTIDGRGVFAQIAKSGTAQITGLARAADGQVYLCTANPGKVFSVGPEFEPEGTYESPSFDAQLFSQWGRIEWWGPPPAAPSKQSASSSEPRIQFFVRSGNTEDPGREWSPWSGPYTRSGDTVQSPPARFVQWKAVIRDGRPGDGLEWVSLAYLPRNVAPVMDAIVLQDPGVRAQGNLQPALAPGQTPVQLKLPPTSNAPSFPGAPLGDRAAPRFEAPPQGFAQKGYRSVLWSAHDDNDDELRFAVYYRGEAERDWKPLKEDLDQKYFSWDTTTLPDGAYYLKIIAADAPSNPPAVALTTARESDRFEVDNTPPVVEQLVTESEKKSAARVVARFVARDAASGIERAQYSLDGGDWTLVAPVSGISDAPEERYEFSLPSLAAGEHTLAVRAYDRFENAGSAKIVFIVPPPSH